MSALRCLIADDEPLAVRLLESYAARTEGLECVAVCMSGREALQMIVSEEIDVAFLDIQMPDMTGIELARAIAGRPTRVVFVTAYRDYAIEGFRVNALDYLLKPVSYSEFAEAVRRAVEARPDPAETRPDHIMVRSDYRLVRVPVDEIMYVEGLKDYVKIYLTRRERPLLTQMSLKAVESALPESDFMRVHRSFIVGMRHLTAIDRGRVVVGGETIPVGDTYRSKVLERLQ
ncbi:MAG: LytTR family DNA-binding domain-containing protein [Bacteroidales bacterium]|nr:LytTR family DNA-binding domain-containing protein [Bacteroidales bacterium]